MSKCSKNMISKNTYISILGATDIFVKDQFMERGGWHLIFGWTNNAIANKDYSLPKELLKLLIFTPVTLPRLKSNRFIIIIKKLFKECKDEDIRGLCRVVLYRWRKFAKEEENGGKVIQVEQQQQPVVTTANAGQSFGGNASISVGRVASSSADGEEGYQFGGMVTPTDNPVTSMVAQQQGPPPPVTGLSSEVAPLGAQGYVDAAGGPIKKFKDSNSSSVKDKKSRDKHRYKDQRKEDKSGYHQFASFFSSTHKFKSSGSFSGGGGGSSSSSKVAAVAQAKKDEETLKKINLIQGSSSSLRWKIPKKPSTNFDNNIPAAPPKQAKCLEKPSDDKTAKLKGESQLAMTVVSEKSSEISKTRVATQIMEEGPNEANSFTPKVDKTLKSCLALKCPPNRPKKTVHWQMEDDIRMFDKDSVIGNRY